MHTFAKKHLATLRLLMASHYSRDTVDEIMSNTEILMQCLMDSSKTRVSDILGDHSDIIADIEEISRNLIFDIHNNRAVNIWTFKLDCDHNWPETLLEIYFPTNTEYDI